MGCGSSQPIVVVTAAAPGKNPEVITVKGLQQAATAVKSAAVEEAKAVAADAKGAYHEEKKAAEEVSKAHVAAANEAVAAVEEQGLATIAEGQAIVAEGHAAVEEAHAAAVEEAQAVAVEVQAAAVEAVHDAEEESKEQADALAADWKAQADRAASLADPVALHHYHPLPSIKEKGPLDPERDSYAGGIDRGSMRGVMVPSQSMHKVETSSGSVF